MSVNRTLSRTRVGGNHIITCDAEIPLPRNRQRDDMDVTSLRARPRSFARKRTRHRELTEFYCTFVCDDQRKLLSKSLRVNRCGKTVNGTQRKLWMQRQFTLSFKYTRVERIVMTVNVSNQFMRRHCSHENHLRQSAPPFDNQSQAIKSLLH